MEDPYIRIQKWGGNLRTNSINLESELLGVGRHANRDCPGQDNFRNFHVSSDKIEYPQCKSLFTEQSRATNPAWWYRDVEQTEWAHLPLNPQENTCFPFHNNLNTRILEKDYFTPKRDVLIHESKNYIGPTNSLIRGGLHLSQLN